jgi:hypothetical protein
MGIAAPAQAHDGKVQAIVGTENLAVAFGRGTDSYTCRAYGKRIKEFASIQHLVSPSGPLNFPNFAW